MICNKIQCFRIFPFGRNYESYIIESIKGPRADELKVRLQEKLQQNEHDNQNYVVRIKYSISAYRNDPTVQIKYKIRTKKKSYIRYLSINIKNNPIPCNISSSFIEELAFNLKSDIQKSITIINNQENAQKNKLTTNEENHFSNQDKG